LNNVGAAVAGGTPTRRPQQHHRHVSVFPNCTAANLARELSGHIILLRFEDVALGVEKRVVDPANRYSEGVSPPAEVGAV
jgi:hypothetical protein